MSSKWKRREEKQLELFKELLKLCRQRYKGLRIRFLTFAWKMPKLIDLKEKALREAKRDVDFILNTFGIEHDLLRKDLLFLYELLYEAGVTERTPRLVLLAALLCYLLDLDPEEVSKRLDLSKWEEARLRSLLKTLLY